MVVGGLSPGAVQFEAPDASGRASGGAPEDHREALELDGARRLLGGPQRPPRRGGAAARPGPVRSDDRDLNDVLGRAGTKIGRVAERRHLLEAKTHEHHDGQLQIWLSCGPAPAALWLTPRLRFEGQVLDAAAGALLLLLAVSDAASEFEAPPPTNA